MKLTRRGIVAVCILAFALIQGYLFGERALNYVVAPGLAALAAGAILLWRAETPTVERSSVRSGFPGETRHETITVEGGGIADVAVASPPETPGEPIDTTVSLPVQLDRKIAFRERGVYTLGPVTVRQRDPLGLVGTTVKFSDQRDVTVYPEIYELDRAAVVGSIIGRDHDTGGQSFDWLREYQDGDPLQRIHWKSTAKHDELLVAHTEPNRRSDQIHVVIDWQRTVTDELASAAASLVVLLFDSDLEVSLTLPDDRIADDSIAERRGQQHRETLLTVLADPNEHARNADAAGRYHLGEVLHETAELLIREESGTVMVRIGDEAVPFDRFRPGMAPPSTSRAPTTTRTVSDG